jgi:hypothetical protein
VDGGVDQEEDRLQRGIAVQELLDVMEPNREKRRREGRSMRQRR